MIRGLNYQALALAIICQAVQDLKRGDKHNPKAYPFLTHLHNTLWGEICSNILNIPKIEKWARNIKNDLQNREKENGRNI